MAPLLTPFAGLDLSEVTDETRLSISLSAMDLGDNQFDALSSSPLTCTESDCPINHPHRQGTYRYEDKDPHKYDFLLGKSNPPPHVWEAIAKMTTGGCSEEDDLAIERFLRYHVPTYKSKLT